MRVAVVLGSCGGWGGTETHGYNLCHHLRNNKHLVFPIVGPPNAYDKLSKEGFLVSDFGRFYVGSKARKRIWNLYIRFPHRFLKLLFSAASS